MNFFETELKKATSGCKLHSNHKYIGSSCIARFTETTTVKITFMRTINAGSYPGILITILNRHEGKIDSLEIRFNDLWTGNGLIRAYTDGKETYWQGRTPTAADYGKLANSISDYLENFAD